MPVKTFDDRILDIPITECVGRKCDDGRFHVILKDGTHGIWIRQAEVEEEHEEELPRSRELLRRYVEI